MKMKINKANILYWSLKYDKKYHPKDREREEKIKKILRSQRYLTRDNLQDIMYWKSPRIIRYADENESSKIKKITQSSFRTKDEKKE